MRPAVRYSATYEDGRGASATEIVNDGENLHFTVRGVTFEGTDWDGPEATEPTRARAEGFIFSGDDLCGFRLNFAMPIALDSHDAAQAELEVALDIGPPREDGRGITHETVQLTLRRGAHSLTSSGKSGWFEDELVELLAQLAELDGSRMRACIDCAYSDYSPYGHGLFGSMACFRDCKDDYLAVNGKHDLFALWDRRARYVQETYCCEQWAPRKSGTGYRG